MSVWTNWDPLQEVIVGNCYAPGDLDWFLPDQAKDAFNKILIETKQDLDALSQFLVSRGITVHRPQVFKYKNAVDLGNVSVLCPMAPIVPRDQYMVYGDTIYQTYTSMTDRLFDSRSYYGIFSNLFDQGMNWISQPCPNLYAMSDSKKWMDQHQDLGRLVYKKIYSRQLLWHTATMFKCGQHLITNTEGPGSARGLDWITRNLPPHTVIAANSLALKNWGHIDHGFFMINDGTVMCVDRSFVPECLQDKRIHEIKALLPADQNQKIIHNLQQLVDPSLGYEQTVSFNTNVLVLDPQNVIFSEFNQPLFDYLLSLGIQSHVCAFRHQFFWAAGIHCVTLDIRRHGKQRKIINEV